MNKIALLSIVLTSLTAAAEITTEATESRLVLTEIKDCKRPAILELQTSNIIERIKLMNRNVKITKGAVFDKSVPASAYYFRITGNGIFQVKDDSGKDVNIVDSSKLEKVMRRYVRSLKLSADIFVEDSNLTNSATATVAFDLVQKNKFGLEFSDDQTSEFLEVKIPVNLVLLKNEIKAHAERVVEELNKQGSLDSHLGDLNAITFLSYLESIPDSIVKKAQQQFVKSFSHCSK